MQGLLVQSLVRKLRSHMPTKNQDINSRSNILTDSIKTLKIVHIKKICKK